MLTYYLLLLGEDSGKNKQKTSFPGSSIKKRERDYYSNNFLRFVVLRSLGVCT